MFAFALALVAGASAQCSGMVGGRQFDLTSLKGDYRTTDGFYSFNIGVCSPPAYTTCSQTVAVCQMYEEWQILINIGSVDTAKLTPNDAGNSVTLTYTGGETCGSGKFYNSMIMFTCDLEAGDGTPEYYSYDYEACTFRFTWKSAKACALGGCSGYVSGQYYDLKLTGDYAATDGSHLIPIGVCATPPRSKCASTVAGCLMYPEWGINLDLGKLNTAYLLPQRVGTAIVLTYQNGATCDTGELYSMTISFQCNQGGPDGQPTLVSFDAPTCVYHFAWTSGQACPKTPPLAALTNSTLIR